MGKNNIILTLLFISILNIYATTPPKNNNKIVNQNTKALQLLKLWDSIQNNEDYIKNPYSILQWEQLLSFEYTDALKRNEQDLALRISIPLSFTYHAETKFSKGIPLLEHLFAMKKKLSKIEFSDVLIKLEEEYRGSNNIEKAILIRKERITNRFINNYWEIYKDCGLYEAAKKDLIQFEVIPPKHSMERLQYYFLLGDLYYLMNEIDSAKVIYTKGLNESKEMSVNIKPRAFNKDKTRYWVGCFMGLIVKCNIQQGNFEKSIIHLKYDILHSFENSDNKIEKMILLSKCYIHFKQYDFSKKYLDSATLLMSDKVSKPIQMSFLLAKTAYYSANKKEDSALIFYQLYNNYRDTLQSRIQQNQSILLLVQLEVANRRNELLESKQSLIDRIKENDQQKTILLILAFFLVISITLSGAIYLNSVAQSKSKDKIEAQNIMINAHSEKIEAQFNHNEILLKELHHRVKNNLQVMYSLLNLQKRRNQDVDTIETLSSIQNRIHTMALVHQNLYNSGDFELVELLSYIETLSNHLISIYKVDKQKVEVKIEIDEKIKLPIEMVVAIGLIVNEAASNSFKYAFKNRGTGILLIKIINSKESIEIVIQDNGDGIQSNITKENSLGMKLINLMCLQLKADHKIEKNNGVAHFLKFNIV